MCHSFIVCTVAVVSLVPLPETVLEEDPLSVCAMLSGVNYTDIPFTVNFTIHSGQGMKSGDCMKPASG